MFDFPIILYERNQSFAADLPGKDNKIWVELIFCFKKIIIKTNNLIITRQLAPVQLLRSKPF
jgi:hypothetical protein